MKICFLYDQMRKVQEFPPSTKFKEMLIALKDVFCVGSQLDLKLISGFPPSPIDFDQDDPISSKIANGETVRIELASKSGIKKSGRKYKKRRKSKKATASSVEEIGGHLVQSVSSQSSSSRDQMLRKAFKSAVNGAYEEAKARVRSEAIGGGTYVLSVSNEKEKEELTARFWSNHGRSVQHEDTVPLIPYSKLLVELSLFASLGDDDMKEMLREHHCPNISPKLFWSVVYHCRKEDSPLPTFRDMLRHLAPQFSWKFVDNRKRRESEKCLMNKIQYRSIDKLNKRRFSEIDLEEEEIIDIESSFDKKPEEEEMKERFLNGIEMPVFVGGSESKSNSSGSESQHHQEEEKEEEEFDFIDVSDQEDVASLKDLSPDILEITKALQIDSLLPVANMSAPNSEGIGTEVIDECQRIVMSDMIFQICKSQTDLFQLIVANGFDTVHSLAIYHNEEEKLTKIFNSDSISLEDLREICSKAASLERQYYWLQSWRSDF